MDWADLVIVMEEKHRRIITKNDGSYFRKKIIVLSIPDPFNIIKRN